MEAKLRVRLNWWLCVTIIVAGVSPLVSRADITATLDVDASKPGVTIPPELSGLMTEEINHSYDGGLYAELIQNRTFQDPRPQGHGADRPPIHWSIIGSGKVTTDQTDPVNAALPISLRLQLDGGEGGIANDGYWGIPAKPEAVYTARFYAKAGGGFSGPLTASLRLDDGDTVVAKADTDRITDTWKKYTITLKTGRDVPTTTKARFVVSAKGSGNVWLSYVSLFPPTYEDAANGLRPDIMKLLADLRPKFIRLPGGNYVEGNRFSDRFNWKQMIGPPDERPGHMGCWSYRSSDGFGMPEYLLWCKQLGAEPLLAVFAGYTLNGDHFAAGSPEMEIYTKEALEEIEYVSGPSDSQWGKKRAEDGFPEPFRLRYVEIGNEDWFDGSGSYDGRFTQLAKAIRERYPDLKLIATAPVKSCKPDLYDDHFYRSPRQLREMFSLYNERSSQSPPLRFEGGGWNGRHPNIQTFVGEWAAHEGRPITNLNAALADAAFVMGLERNSDAVAMQCYAPLFANVNPADQAKGYPRGWQWDHDLIGYDALRSYGSPSYYAQVMLAQNKGDVVLPTKFDVSQGTQMQDQSPHGAIGIGSWQTDVEYTDVSVTAPDGRTLLAPARAGDIKGWQFVGGDWRVQDKAIKPTQPDAASWGFTGDSKWTDYTFHLRARKLGGREGFIVIWHVLDNDNYQWWNIGGWGNTATRAEAAVDGAREAYGPSAPFTVETGRWYDLRLEVTDSRVRGSIDGKLVTDTTYEQKPHSTSAPVYASASYDRGSSTALVKVVNAGTTPVDTAINIRTGRVEPNGTAIVLSGEPAAVNTLDEPKKVVPKQEAVINASASFRRTFPAHSFTILRLQTSAR